MNKGRIIKGVGGIYTIVDLETKNLLTANLRGKLRYVSVDKNSSFNVNNTYKTKLENKVIKLNPKVGDYVHYTIIDGVNTIDEIYERRNDLERPSIANVDQVLLIFAAKKPLFQLELLDMFLVLMEKNNVTVKIVITKIDLLSDIELTDLKNKMAYYDKIGYEVFFVNSKTGKGIDEVREVFTGKVSVLSGQTGAGKSTFINAVIPGFKLQTQEISEALGRGKHTTTYSELYEYNNGYIGDTPGFSKLDFTLIKENELKDYFIDFPVDECKFRGCLHDQEPGCKVKELVLSGDIAKWRYENYLKFLKGIKNTIKKY